MYEYSDIDEESIVFEWDDDKDAANFRKHGIRFRTAAKVFYDPDKLIREDIEHPSELRFDVIGKIGRILFVVCTIREENIIRLISAQIATAAEKERYENGETYDA